MWIPRRFDCLLLVFIRRWGRLLTRCPMYHDNLMQLADVDPHCSGEFWFSERADSKLFSRRFAIVPVSRCVSWSLVSTLQEFDSIIPVDFIRVKSYVNSFLDSFGVPVWVLINKLYFTPVRVVAGLVGVLRNGKGLGTGYTYIPLVFFHPLLHRSFHFTNVDFAAFTGNPVNHVVLSN